MRCRVPIRWGILFAAEQLVRRIKILVRRVSWNGVGCLLRLSEERQKGEKMTTLLVRAFRFNIWVRLKDDYKSHCGQWALHFIYGGHLGYTPYQHNGYQLNQVLFTSFAILSELLSKMSSDCSSSLPLTFIVRSRVTKGSSTISNQLEVGSIMVRAIKSICKPSWPLIVYGPIRSTHKPSHRGRGAIESI